MFCSRKNSIIRFHLCQCSLFCWRVLFLVPRAPWVLKLTCKSELGAVTLRPQVEKEDERLSGKFYWNEIVDLCEKASICKRCGSILMFDFIVVDSCQITIVVMSFIIIYSSNRIIYGSWNVIYSLMQLLRSCVLISFCSSLLHSINMWWFNGGYESFLPFMHTFLCYCKYSQRADAVLAVASLSITWKVLEGQTSSCVQKH